MQIYDEEELLQRAHIAYRKTGKIIQPLGDACGVVEMDGEVYVVLRNTHDILAVYQYKKDSLKALTTWPSVIQ
jgi:hypothetical protein